VILAVNVLCRNFNDDRVIPRFSRYLRDHLGWHLTKRPDPAADVYYLSGYFEYSFMQPMPDRPVAAYFTHREEQPPPARGSGNAKAKLFDSVAQRVDLRIATAAMYGALLAVHGPTVQIAPPVERHRFSLPVRPGRRNQSLVAGLSGYTYSNRRKGEDLAKVLVASKAAPRPTPSRGQALRGGDVEWRASGRGWPVATKRYPWSEMPAFYQSLDVLVVTARVEGVPMPALEALACGVSVVVPRGVGLLNELPDVLGIHRYKRGNAKDLVRAFSEAEAARGDVDRQALRSVTEPYSIAAWCEGHRQAFEDAFLWKLDEPMLETVYAR